MQSVTAPARAAPGLRLIAIAGGARMGISRRNRAPQCLFVGRVIDVFSRKIGAFDHSAGTRWWARYVAISGVAIATSPGLRLQKFFMHPQRPRDNTSRQSSFMHFEVLAGPGLGWTGATQRSINPVAIFHRLFFRGVAQPTDGPVGLMVSEPRSVPASPLPLWRVIGHHWPWYSLPGPIAFFHGSSVHFFEALPSDRSNAAYRRGSFHGREFISRKTTARRQYGRAVEAADSERAGRATVCVFPRRNLMFQPFGRCVTQIQ